MVKEFNSLDEIKKYYDEKTNTYVFKENDVLIDFVNLRFDLDIKSDIICASVAAWDITAINIFALDIVASNINAESIVARHINALHIIVKHIEAYDISAWDICAKDIIFNTSCIAFKDIKCASINGAIDKSFYISKEGDVIIDGKKQTLEIKPSIADFKNGEVICIPKIKILCVEDGSIDELAMQQIRGGANLDGKMLVYRRGCKPPYVLEI